MEDRVLIEWHDHVAHVQLNRPDKMNALDDAMFDGLCAAGDALKANDKVRAVVLSGNGKAFCSGLDLSNFKPPRADGTAEPGPDSPLVRRTHGLANRPQYASWVWRELQVPVIAALHGAAIGGGCQIALGADIRYAHPETKIAIFEMQWGLVPDMGATPFLLECVADDVARELTYTNRIVLGEEARGLGLVTRLCDDPVAAALETAQEIALRNPDAVRGAKRIFNEAPFKAAADILLLESEEQDKVIGKANQVERAMSVMQKRAPVYK